MRACECVRVSASLLCMVCSLQSAVWVCALFQVDWSVTNRPAVDSYLIDREERVQFYNDNAELYDDHVTQHGYTGHTEVAKALHRNVKGEEAPLTKP